MIITEAEDETKVVYDPPTPTTTLALEHTVPANTLRNGKQYQARLRVRPKNGQWSEYSEPIKFWCFAQPLFQFTVDGSVPTGDPPTIGVQNSSITVNLTYKQADTEGLKSYKVDLYGTDGRLLAAGQEKYNTGDIRYDMTDLSTTIRGLEDNGRYSIQAVGETDHGMIIKTERVYLHVDYDHPATFALIEVENLPKTATIRIHSNLEMLEGWCTQNPPRYIDNERIDLTGYGARVIFDKGFNLDGDFALHVVAQNMKEYDEILHMQNGFYEIVLTYLRGFWDDDMNERAYFMLEVYNNVMTYEVYSEFIPVPYFDDKVHLWVRRIGSLYDLQACICESGSHNILNPNEFYVQMRNYVEWNDLIVEGYRNEPENRLEF